MSPRRFSGWEPARIYHRNEAREVVRVTLEPEWSDEDREKALALQTFEASLCGGCRDDLAKTTDPANEDAYEAEDPVRCHRCTAVQRKAERYQETPQSGALMFPVHRKDLPVEPSP